MIDFNIKDYLKSELLKGLYTFKIIDATLKPTKNNPECQYINLKLKVISDFRRGSTVYDRLNIYNTSEIAQDIARQNLAELCAACNIPEMKLISQLIGKIIDAEYDPAAKTKFKYAEVKAKNAYEQLTAEDIPFDDDIKF